MRSSSLVFTALFFAGALPLSAQRSRDYDPKDWLEDCRSGRYNSDDRGRACEVRDASVKVSGRSIEVDGRANGSVRIVSTDGDVIRVQSRLQANARSDSDAEAMLKEVKISTDGNRISSDGPRNTWRNEGWSVSYVVWVPKRFDVRVEANNGSIGVDGVVGRLDLQTTNGSVNLTDVGGDVRAHTQNGSMNIELGGSKWEGAGLDAETQNGSVRMRIPTDYAARIETGTVNGRMNTDFPVTLSGRIGRELTLPLNGGGTTLRARTTNGSVTLSRR